MPTPVVVVMIKAETFNSSYSTNPFNSEYFSMETLGLYVDDQSVPGKPLKMNYEQTNYTAAFNSLFDPFEERGSFIIHKDFPLGYALYVFHTVPYHLPPHMPAMPRGNVKRTGNFAKTLAKNVTMLVYMQFTVMMSIDSARNVTK